MKRCQRETMQPETDFRGGPGPHEPAPVREELYTVSLHQPREEAELPKLIEKVAEERCSRTRRSPSSNTRTD